MKIDKSKCRQVLFKPNGREVSGELEPDDYADWDSTYGYADRFFVSDEGDLVWYRQFLYSFYAKGEIKLKFGVEYYDHDGHFGTPESGELTLTEGWFWEVIDEYKPS